VSAPNRGAGDAELGAKLRYLRERRRLPLKAVAPKAGVTIGTLSDYEKGRVMPGIRVLVRLYKLYGVHPSYLIDHLGDEDPAA
jgi:transcriptional regulator with XRE-family HTH domain